MKNMKIDDVIAMIKANDLIKKEEEKKPCVLLWVLGIIGAVAVIAAIAYAVYLYFTPDYLEDFEDDFDDDFDDDFFEEEEEVKKDTAE
nr:DUF4366 domain-containing protein [Lachnospiraceae bacterium]